MAPWGRSASALARTRGGFRFAAVLWVALILCQITGVHHRAALLPWVAFAGRSVTADDAIPPLAPSSLAQRHSSPDQSDPPLTPIRHGHHADQRIVGPPPEESGSETGSGYGPVQGPAEMRFALPTASPTSATGHDPDPLLSSLAHRELPPRAPPALLTA